MRGRYLYLYLGQPWTLWQWRSLYFICNNVAARCAAECVLWLPQPGAVVGSYAAVGTPWPHSGRWYVGSDPISRPLWRMSSQHRLMSEHVQASILQTPLLLLSCSNSCLGRFDSKDEAILIYLATRQDRIYQGVPLTETFLGSETDINQSGREISKWIKTNLFCS